MNAAQDRPNPERIAILVALGNPGSRPPTLRLGFQLLPVSGVITVPLPQGFQPCI
jgi:hypothetical protein